MPYDRGWPMVGEDTACVGIADNSAAPDYWVINQFEKRRDIDLKFSINIFFENDGSPNFPLAI